MESVFNITGFIIDHQGSLTATVVVGCFVLALIIAVAEYRDRLWKRIINRRNKWYFVFLAVMAGILIILSSKHIIIFPWVIVNMALWISLLILCFSSLRPVCLTRTENGLEIHEKKCIANKNLETENNNSTESDRRDNGQNKARGIQNTCHLYRDKRLERYRDFLNEGSATEHISEFLKLDPERSSVIAFFTDPDVQLEYLFLKAAYFSAVSEDDKAYEVLQSIDSRLLYSEERNSWNIERAESLSILGDINAARELLGNPEENNSKDPEVWIAYAFISETQGDIDQAFEYAKKAKALAEISDLPDWMKALIYNDYGRFTFEAGNKYEALDSYKIAWRKIQNSTDVRNINVIASNLVTRMAYEGATRQKCYKFFRSYKKKIKELNIHNSIELENCELVLSRQFDDERRTFQLIKDGYYDIKDKLDVHQLEIFKASTFRMIMNGSYVREWFDPEIRLDLDYYRQLTTMERLSVFNTYIGILTQNEYISLRHFEPYKTLYSMIMEYYKDQAIDEIDEELSRTESYCVYKRNNLIKNKIGILRQIQGKEHIYKSKDIYLEQYKVLCDAGLSIEAVNMIVLLMDECTSSHNVRISVPKWVPAYRMDGNNIFPAFTGLVPVQAWSGYYSDFQEQALESAPKATDVGDGIHVAYSKIGFKTPIEVNPVHKDIVKDNIDKALTAFETWKNHPFKVELSIELAHLCMAIERYDDAEKMIRFFDSTKVSSKQFAISAREDVAAIKADLRRIREGEKIRK